MVASMNDGDGQVCSIDGGTIRVTAEAGPVTGRYGDEAAPVRFDVGFEHGTCVRCRTEYRRKKSDSPLPWEPLDDIVTAQGA